ncbi:MAG: right-handed parallel beta-helix repeat-containing protein, partial [Parcubacteria group bacterium]|nr:right-handed parallel beta-helix repeat-containing protein [Parcubacteria group bacterium]
MSKIFQILKIEDLRKKILIAALSLICFVSFINIAAAASIQDNATGGDCNLIGAWDGATKTCTLTQDVYEIIQIDSDGITLDGNGHKIIGTDDIGVYLFQRTGATVKNINVEGSIYGIYLQSSSNNTISNNVVSNNSETGLTLSDSHGNLITENEISNNQTGLEILYVVPMSDNKIYHNNFLNNNEQIYAVYDASDSFSQNPPIGGNYWSNFDESLEGCIDSNSDNFCDSPFIFNQNSQDNYPWTKQNGWKISTNQPPTIYNFNQYKSDVQTEISKGGIITENVAIFKANIIDPDGDDAKLEIELRKIDELGGGFANTATASSTYIASGATSTIAVYGLSE